MNSSTEKEKQWKPMLRVCLGILLVIAVVFVAIFLWSAYDHYNEKYIDVNRLQTTPDDFVVLTEEELDRHPAINEAIASQRMVKVKPDEWNRINDFLSQQGTYNIKVGNDYYEVLFATA